MICWYGNERVALTDHALQRYMERVRPGLDLVEVKAELREILKFAAFTREPPVWTESRDDAAALVLCDEIAFTLQPVGVSSWVASTCVTVAALNRARRAGRNAAKARQRAARQAKRRSAIDRRNTKRIRAEDRGPRSGPDAWAA